MTRLPPRDFFERHGDLCRSCANPNRLKLLDVLRDGECSVSTLTETTGIPQPTVSNHLNVLRERGVVSRRKEGVRCYYSITDERIYTVIDNMRSMTKEGLRNIER